MFGSSGTRTSTGSKVVLNVYDLGELIYEWWGFVFSCM